MDPGDALDELRSMLGERPPAGKGDLSVHGRSETWPPEISPDPVVHARGTDEVAAIVGTCAPHGLPLIGRGNGTTLEGHG